MNWNLEWTGTRTSYLASRFTLRTYESHHRPFVSQRMANKKRVVIVGGGIAGLGQKYNRTQLLESILEPSKLIGPKYVTYLAETGDGRLFTGLLVKKNGCEVVPKVA